ncbi:DUF1396 domain-containing protein [Streptomyces sp. NPDC020379]|uniref:DUF1396 domain-containing protein n=1 Tax=Streptomyces sp. NPDC020379 TaxID=3365071 RepID=UPI00379C34F0
MRTTYRNPAGAVLSAALLCGTAACSSSGEGKAAPKAEASAEDKGSGARKPTDAATLAAVRRATARTEDITSLSYSVTGQQPGAGTIDGEAAMDLKSRAMRMKMRVKGASADESGGVEFRMVGGAFYMKGSNEAEGESRWIKFDLSGLKGAGDSRASLGSQADRSPADDASGIGSAKDLAKAGEETVDGVRTTHYTGTVTLDQLRQSLKDKSPEVRQRREKSLDEYAKMGADGLRMDIWVDGQDRTKQVRTRAATAKGPMDLTVKFHDVNKPVTVEAPPASEVMDLAGPAKGAQGGPSV